MKSDARKRIIAEMLEQREFMQGQLNALDGTIDELARDNAWATEKIRKVVSRGDSWEFETHKWTFILVRKSFLMGKKTPKPPWKTITFYGRGAGYTILGVAVNGKRVF